MHASEDEPKAEVVMSMPSLLLLPVMDAFICQVNLAREVGRSLCTAFALPELLVGQLRTWVLLLAVLPALLSSANVTGITLFGVSGARACLRALILHR